MAEPSKTVSIRMGPQGRVVIPAEFRRQLEIDPGETLAARIESGRLVLEPRGQILERLRRELHGATPPGRSMVDELITERREESGRKADASAG